MQNNDAIKQVAKDMGVAKNVIYNHIVEVKKIVKNTKNQTKYSVINKN